MSIIRLLSMIIFTIVLANCGSQSVGSPAATRLPSATVQTTNTDATSTPATPIVATDQPTAVANTIDSLASGLTPEGYHVLGNMTAPITFVDYSDYF
jgi:protein-disulfide isomerase